MKNVRFLLWRNKWIELQFQTLNNMESMIWLYALFKADDVISKLVYYTIILWKIYLSLRTFFPVFWNCFLT